MEEIVPENHDDIISVSSSGTDGGEDESSTYLLPNPSSGSQEGAAAATTEVRRSTRNRVSRSPSANNGHLSSVNNTRGRLSSELDFTSRVCQIFDVLEKYEGWVAIPGNNKEDWTFVPPSMAKKLDEKEITRRQLRQHGTDGVHYANGWLTLGKLFMDFGLDHDPKDFNESTPNPLVQGYTIQRLYDELITEVPVDGKKPAAASKTPESDHGHESDGTETELNFTVSTSTESDDDSESISSSRETKRMRTSSPNRAVATDSNAASIDTTSAADTSPTAASTTTSPRDPSPAFGTTIAESTPGAETANSHDSIAEVMNESLAAVNKYQDTRVHELEEDVKEKEVALSAMSEQLKERNEEVKQLKEQLEKEMESMKRKSLELVEENDDLTKKSMEREKNELLSDMEELKDKIDILEADKNEQSCIIERQRRQLSPSSGGEDILRMYDEGLIETIKATIVNDGEDCKLDDIAGLEQAKKTIHQIVTYPLRYPNVFKGVNAPSNGVLLFGPPGNGKSMIAKAIANESGATLFSLTGTSDLVSKWIGEGEKMVKILFAMAAHHAPSIIFMDEVDSLFTSRKAEEDNTILRMKREFLVQLDVMRSKRDGNGYVLFMGSTNLPQDLDENLRDRFQKRFYIPKPNQQARESLLRNIFAQQPHSLNDADFIALSQETEGYSGRDLMNLYLYAFNAQMESLSPKEMARINAGRNVLIISREYCNLALNMPRSSSSLRQADLEVYDDWNKEYGTKPCVTATM